MNPRFKAIRQRRPFTNVDCITTHVEVRGDYSQGGTYEVDVFVSNEEYRSGRYRDLVWQAACTRATQACGVAISYMKILDVHVCLDGKWHAQKVGKWPVFEY